MGNRRDRFLFVEGIAIGVVAMGLLATLIGLGVTYCG